MKIRIEDNLCMGHGRCYDLTPEIFAPDEAGHGRVLCDRVTLALADKARLAEQNCPEAAIFIEDKD